jgi:hypothetical protein
VLVMTDRVTPHDTDTELALLGAMWLTTTTNRGLALDALTAADFYGPGNAELFAAIGTMHRRGDPMDAHTLADDLRRSGSSSDLAMAVVTAKGITSSIPAYVDIITRLAVARSVQSAGIEITQAAQPGTMSAGELVELAHDRIAAIDVPAMDGAALTGLSTVDDFVDTADTTPAPWVIPGMMRAGWRCVVVAPEGLGKSVAFRSIAIAAAAGVHPFAHTPITPVRTLIIDLENPDDAIAETAGPMSRTARKIAGHSPDRAWIWRRMEGIDLRSRADRAAFHQVLEQVRPDLVCLGPLYKAYRKVPRESDEDAAADVQHILDDARVRHSFALLMEHHAPQGSGLGAREMRPYGSSLWLRWPEMGLKLTLSENGPKDSLDVGRWRRDRMKCDWPDRIDRSEGGWPWSGVWAKGMTR